jgi:hypothetical protein
MDEVSILNLSSTRPEDGSLAMYQAVMRAIKPDAEIMFMKTAKQSVFILFLLLSITGAAYGKKASSLPNSLISTWKTVR